MFFDYLAKHKSASTDELMALKARLTDLTHMYCGSNIDKSNFYLHRQHINVVKSLRNNDYIVISNPDKGSTVVILSRCDYFNKITNILNNSSKFTRQGMVDEFDKTTNVN